MVYETGILKKYKNFREGNFVKKTTLEHRRVKFCSPAKSNSLLIGSSSKRGVATGFLKKDSVRPKQTVNSSLLKISFPALVYLTAQDERKAHSR